MERVERAAKKAVKAKEAKKVVKAKEAKKYQNLLNQCLPQSLT